MEKMIRWVTEVGEVKGETKTVLVRGSDLG